MWDLPSSYSKFYWPSTFQGHFQHWKKRYLVLKKHSKSIDDLEATVTNGQLQNGTIWKPQFTMKLNLQSWLYSNFEIPLISSLCISFVDVYDVLLNFRIFCLTVNHGKTFK